MPTPNPDQYTSQIKSIQGQIDKSQNALDSSVTGSSSVLAPTRKDVSNEVESDNLKNTLRTLQKKQLSEAWYGNDQTDSASDEGSSAGLIGKGLNLLSKPLYGIVAGTKSLIGDAPNPKMNEDFSDLLKEHNVPYPISAPLGFALDVTLDPLNWLTAGTGALIPRTALGLTRGLAKGGVETGLKAAAEGAKSNLLQKAAGTLKFIPGMGDSSFRQGLATKANESWETYKGLTDHDPLARINQAGADLPFATQRYNLQDLAKGVMSYIPGGNGIYKSLYYSSRDWLDNQRLLDSVERAAAPTLAKTRAPGQVGKTLSEADVEPGAAELSNPLIKPNLDLLKGAPAGQERDALIDEMNKVADDASFVDKNPSKVVSDNPEQNTWRVIQEAQNTDQLRDVMSQLKSQYDTTAGATGVQWYDNAINWAKDQKMKIGDKEVKPLKEFLDGYQALIQGVFKPAHTILSPVTWSMNVMSAPIMYMMMGGENVGQMMKNYARSYSALLGVDPRTFVMKKFLTPEAGDAWNEFFKTNPGITRKTFGVGPAWFQGNAAMKDIVDKGRSSGIFDSETDDEALKAIQDFSEEMQSKMRSGAVGEDTKKPGSFLARMLSKTTQPDAGTPSGLMDDLRKSLKEGELPPEADLPAGFTTRDPNIDNPILDRVENWVRTKAKDGSKPAQIFQSMMDGARAGYEHQDQAFRLAMATSLTQDGLSENGVKIVSRFSPFKNPETDLAGKYVSKDGKTMYRLSPMKAIDIANDAAINYAAMPAAIRMFRTMPLLGGPFASFSYGMGLRTLQTLAYNPSLLNKGTFAIKSFSGNKTPLERQALNPGPGQPNYYGWYNDPSMLRMPFNFFDNYPLYLNLTNALPYYTLNIFQPANRTYNSVLPNSIVQTLDKSPIMKDPIGSTLFDFFVLPSILANSGETPESSIGSPIYPSNATPLQKGGYFARNIADAFTPAAIAPVGLAAPSELAQYYPGYRTRQFAEGRDERNALGIPGSESAASRTVRNVLGYLGLPFQRLDTTVASSRAQNGQ